ncbi:MAG: DNA-processing protein DprA [Corynebacterium sp.]|jgi:DNA processing protein|uniref:DNA-processing protein DprA n=1 Tax=Corynebacterium sp. TaxID=1720 RepID=UPI003EFE8B9E
MRETETGNEMGDDDVARQKAWMYLRRVVEASQTELLDLLWPDGVEDGAPASVDTTAPADVERAAGMIRRRDPALPDVLLESTRRRADVDAESDLTFARENGWRLLTPDSDEWPTELLAASFMNIGPDTMVDGIRGQATQPFALWATGTAKLNEVVDRSVAMVGTRSSTAYGNRTTHAMAGELASAGYTVVSGGALGIDTAAHSGALSAGGRTVVVTATGPGQVYPRSNERLFHAASGRGLVISEYPPHQRAARHRFLTRNRLVAALSQGTVLLAAGYRSGAVNTANWADTMYRPVMVLPGPVDSADYIGCHKRIRDGAGILITRAADIREILEPLGTVDTERQLSLEFGATPVQRLNTDQLRVYDACGVDNDTLGGLEQISAETSLPINAVARIITDLETLNLVTRSRDRWIKVREHSGRT